MVEAINLKVHASEKYCTSNVMKVSQEAEEGEGMELATDSGPLQSDISASSPSTVNDDILRKKRTCVDTTTPSLISNKKTKEADNAAVVRGGIDSQKDTAVAEDGRHINDRGNDDASDKESGWPLSNIKSEMITDNDVLLVESFIGKKRTGNIKYRELLQNKKDLYKASPKGMKSSVVADIIREWRSQDPPGRFLNLDYDGASRKWTDAGDKAVGRKISLILGRASRKKLPDHGEVSFNGEDQPGADEKAGVTSPVTLNTDVHPHELGSVYADVMSFFASTPFAGGSMRHLHEQKKCNKTKKSLIVPARANLPIVPQKQFMTGKTSGTEDVQKNEASSVERKVSKFLLDEAKYLLKSLEEKKRLVKATTPKAKTRTKPLLQHTHSSTKVPNIRQALPQALPQTLPQALPQTLPQTLPQALPWTLPQTLPQTLPKFGCADPRMLSYPHGSGAPVSWPVSWPNGQHAIIQNPLFASNQALMAAFQARVMNFQIAPQIVMASMGFNSSAIAPHSLGLQLKSNDVSKHYLAQAAAQKRTSMGTKMAKPKVKTSRVAVRHVTPKTPNATSGSSTPKNTPKTPKTPRTPALLLSTTPVPGLPKGWIAKTFKRSSGKTAGHKDMYFYSPRKEIKFRSMKGCQTFIGILAEPSVEGNERRALKIYKRRGNKF